MTCKIYSLPMVCLLVAACQSPAANQTTDESSPASGTTATAEASDSEQQVATATPDALAPESAESSEPVTYQGDWIFEGRPYPFKIEVVGDSATYTDLGARGKSWQASSVTREGNRIMMEIEDYKFRGYPYGDIGLTIVGAAPDGTCDRVNWHGAAAFTSQAEFTAECNDS